MSIHTPGKLAEHLPLKPLDLAILVVLERGPEYGYRIVKEVAEPEAGGIRLSPSNLYNVLDRMIRAGLVEDRGREARDDGPPRRFFAVTPLGREVRAAEVARVRAVVRAAEGGVSG